MLATNALGANHGMNPTSTMDLNDTIISRIATTNRHLGLYQILCTISYVTGIVGNGVALIILYKSARIRNRKQTLMLKCLALNELVALLGMLVSMYLKLYCQEFISDYWKCVFRVVLRIFGVGSGCVAIVMAFERWMALTRPFQCKKVRKIPVVL